MERPGSALRLGRNSPFGGEFQVNTYTTNRQIAVSVSVDADGDFVVVWLSYSSSSPPLANSVQGQRYASDGTALGGEFQVNTYTTGLQFLPSVSLDADGDFVVVWNSDGSSGTDSSDRSIQGQRYSSSGSALGTQFQVDTYTIGSQRCPTLALDSAGAFVVVWQSAGSGGADTSSYSVQGQRYASSGTPLGAEFQVNTFTTNNQRGPSVSMDGTGDFVVVWDSYGSSSTDSSYGSIQGQRYDSSGTPVGSQFQVNPRHRRPRSKT